LYLLYELSVLLANVIFRRRQAKATQSDENPIRGLA
jgi:hypothetical protein